MKAIIVISIVTLSLNFAINAEAQQLRRNLKIKVNTTTPILTELEEDTPFDISQYLYVNSVNSNNTNPRIHVYCNTFKPSCVGIQDYERAMFQIWTKYWAEAGWNPIILSINEARTHPMFVQYYQSFQSKQFTANQYHNYLRYLAMSNTPGAYWFADLHVLPLNPMNFTTLPNNGKLTVFDRSCPSLVSGTPAEWSRLTRIMLDNPKSNDVFTLTALLDDAETNYASQKSVLHAKYVIGTEQFDQDICTATKDKYAVRLSLNEFKTLGKSIKLYKSVASSYQKVFQANCLSENRPVIHTFFQPIKSISTSGSMSLLEAWKKVWKEAGWEPIVLGLSDLTRHPKCNDILDSFEKVESGGYTMSLYDKMCFYRWFAMSASGGGWMSDIDAFPLHMPPAKNMVLPNNGILTGYARHVPCLVSGKPSEWERLAWILVDSYKIHSDEFWSDMLALQEVHEILNVFEYRRESVEFHSLFDKSFKLEDPYRMDAGDKNRCDLTKDKRIVHFSHYSVRQGIEGVGFGVEDFNNQERIAVKWTEAWKDQCKSIEDDAVTEVTTETDFKVSY